MSKPGTIFHSTPPVLTKDFDCNCSDQFAQHCATCGQCMSCCECGEECEVQNIHREASE